MRFLLFAHRAIEQILQFLGEIKKAICCSSDDQNKKKCFALLVSHYFPPQGNTIFTARRNYSCLVCLCFLQASRLYT